MKFLTYMALIATTAAVRLQATNQVEAFAEVEGNGKPVPSPVDVWKQFDTDKSNSWSLAETKAAFKGAMKYFGYKLPKGWQKIVKAEFKKADADGSGEVTPKEMGVYLFEVVDENGDGEWCKKEARDAVQAVADFSGNVLENGWEKHVDAAFDLADVNKDDRVSPKEVLAALEKHGVPNINDLFKKKAKALKLRQLIALMKNGKAVPSPEEVWKHFDKNGDGEWDLAEAQAAIRGGLEHFGHEVPADIDEQVAKHFKEVDADGSGKISPMEMGAWVFDLIDSDDDGEIQLDELNAAIEEIAKFTGNTLKKGWKKMVKDAVSGVDTDGSGGASMKEIMAALKKHGVPNINDLFEGH